MIRKETKGRWERRRGRSDTLGRGGFAPLIGWILNSGHRQTTTLRPLASSATMIEICIRREVKHSDKVHDPVRGANSPHDFREKRTWSTYPVWKKENEHVRFTEVPSSVAYASLPINSNATCATCVPKRI